MVGQPPLMSLLSTFSVNLVLIGVGTAVWGTALFNVEVSVPGISIGRYTFPGAHILAAALAAVIAVLLYLFLHYTRLGKAVRAVANNREAAELVGIPTTHVLAVSVGFGVALAGVSGMLIGTLFPFTVLSGDGYQLKSFVVTVLGGLGNPVGALMGGVALGLLEGARHALRAGELDPGDRIRAVRRRADRVSRRHLRVKARSTVMLRLCVSRFSGSSR